jgi:Holliday junction resolvase RusA-like endonuclease
MPDESVPILECIVLGPAASVNWKDKKSRHRKNYAAYKRRVASAALSTLPSGFELVRDETQATIVYFYSGDANRDVDNIVKPILDGLGGEEDLPVLWHNDGNVVRLIVEKFDNSYGMILPNQPRLIEQMDSQAQKGNFVYLRIDRLR